MEVFTTQQGAYRQRLWDEEAHEFQSWGWPGSSAFRALGACASDTGGFRALTCSLSSRGPPAPAPGLHGLLHACAVHELTEAQPEERQCTLGHI